MTEPYHIQLSRRARRYLERLSRAERARIYQALQAIALDPYASGSIALRGLPDSRRIRVGSRRLVYRVDDERRWINVAAIGPRGDVYKDL